MSKYDPKKFLSEEQKRRLLLAIQEAEAQTSGEIRVHLQQKCHAEPMAEARKVFEKLGMSNTALKNSILFFLSLEDHHFVVLGDWGIHEKVKDEFWHAIRNRVLDHFNQGEFIEGLEAGIRKCGEKLSAYFPRQSDDQNELDDNISLS